MALDLKFLNDVETAALSPEPSLVRRRAGKIITFTAGTIVLLFGAGKVFYDRITTPMTQATGTTADAMKDPQGHILNFESLREGTVLLDAHDPDFAPVNVRFRQSRMTHEGPKERSAIVRFSTGPEGRGPVFRVGDALFSFADVNPNDKKRWSMHVSSITAAPSAIRLSSNTLAFKDMAVEVDTSALLNLIEQLPPHVGVHSVSNVPCALIVKDQKPQPLSLVLHIEREPVERLVSSGSPQKLAMR